MVVVGATVVVVVGATVVVVVVGSVVVVVVGSVVVVVVGSEASSTESLAHPTKTSTKASKTIDLFLIVDILYIVRILAIFFLKLST